MSHRNDDSSPDPLHELFRPLFEDRQRKIEEHAAIRDSPPFRGAVKHLDRLAEDYLLALGAIEWMATRWPLFFEGLITLRVKPRLAESLATALWMVKDGGLDPARRELRFLLESSVKCLWLDKGGPKISGTSPDSAHDGMAFDVVAKAEALDDLGQERFGDIVACLEFGLLDELGARSYRATATDLYRQLSSFIHMTSGNVGRDLDGCARHRAISFESVADVNAFSRLARRVLDVALASHFEAFDPGLVGDILVHVFDDRPRWTFRRARLVGSIDRRFDYKAERNRSG